MTADDLAVFARDLAADTKAFVLASIAESKVGLVERCATLEQEVSRLKELIERQPQPEAIVGPVGPEGKPGRDGQDVSIETVKAHVSESVAAATVALPSMVRDEVAKAVAAVPVPTNGRDGKDADFTAVKTLTEALVASGLSGLPGMVTTAVKEAIALIPVPKDGTNGQDGKSVDPAIVDVMVATQVERAVKAIPLPKDGVNGQDGASVTVADVAPLIVAEVAKAVAAIPHPVDGLNGRDGESVSVADVAPLITAEVTKAVAAWPIPKDGKDAPPVDWKSIDLAIASHVEHVVARLPLPKDGHDGKDADPAQLQALESEVKALRAELSTKAAADAVVLGTPDDVSESLELLCRKELGVLSMRPSVRQKRIVRDVAGKIAAVVDEVIG